MLCNKLNTYACGTIVELMHNAPQCMANDSKYL